jgi:hypothetical protein
MWPMLEIKMWVRILCGPPWTTSLWLIAIGVVHDKSVASLNWNYNGPQLFVCRTGRIYLLTSVFPVS